MKGVYKLFKDGVEVAKSDNIITEFGKDAIIKYLCGAIPSWGDALSIGINDTATTSSDTSLSLEVSREKVFLQSPSIHQEIATSVSGSSGAYTISVTKSSISGFTNDISIGMAVSGTGIASGAIVTGISGTSTYTVTLSKANTGSVSGNATFTSRKIILRASVPSDVSAYIYETGLYTSVSSLIAGGYDSNIITAFDEGIISGDTSTWLTGTGVTSTVSSPASTSRIGTGNIEVTAGNSTILGSDTTSPTTPGNIFVDLSGYSLNDTAKILVHAKSGSSTSGSFTITMYDDQSTPASISWTESGNWTSGTSYFKSKKFSAWTAVSGTFNYNVSAIKIATTGVNFAFDVLSVDNTDPTETTYGLVSRSVLSSPISKKSGENLDIQYELMLGI